MVRARYENDLGFSVAGKIVTRVVNVGDRVHVGDVVARLDPQDLKLQVESAEAEFAAATSNLAQAAADLERYTTLRARGYASVADFDRKKAAKDEAEGRLERAKRSLDLARNQLDYADLRADADGVITATLAEPGQVVAIGQAVVRLAHPRREGSRGRIAGDLARRGAQVGRGRAVVVGARPRPSTPGCASCRRRPTQRRAPMRRALPSASPTTPSRSG